MFVSYLKITDINMKALKIIFFIAILILFNTSLINFKGSFNNNVYAQFGNSYELGVEFPEGGGSGCVALCGRPGLDCIIEGQFPVSCGPGEKD